MGLPSNTNALQNGFWQGYTVGRSLRFRSSASAYLNRTPASAGNRKTWTWSGWVKRGTLGSNVCIFGAGTSAADYVEFLFQNTNIIQFYVITSSTNRIVCSSSAVFRDPSAWYHIMLAVDTTQATNSNGVKLYVNGVQQTLSFASYTQNVDTAVNNTVSQTIGQVISIEYFDGYIAEVNFVDGQQLTPSSFGAYDNNGIWEPIKYTGTYGTNGFYLPFSNTTSTTTLVADASGNSNNWTPNNISLTAGTTYDSMIDSPTVSFGSSNYATWNPVFAYGNQTFSNANLTLTTGTSGGSIGTISVSSGKWYWEVYPTSVSAGARVAGLTKTTVAATSLLTSSVYWQQNGTYLINNGSSISYGTSSTASDVIGVALDVDAQTVIFYKNGSAMGAAISISSVYSVGDLVTPSMVQSGAVSQTISTNFGQQPFTYTPPSGYNSLNTYNLPASLVQNGSQYMAATTYTANGTTQSISNAVNGVSFQPDLVWQKRRNSAGSHYLADSVRGASKLLSSDTTAAEATNTTFLTSFNSDGWSQGTGNYTNGESIVGWQWKGGGTGVTNTAGTITSTVSVSAQSGFSIVSYTGTGAAATIGHGLGVAPQMLIVKKTSAVDNWGVYHVADPSPAASYALTLNSTATAGLNTTYWNAVAPTSSVFSVGTAAQTNTNGATYIAYCFAPVNGYSIFGSYAGNGSATDGPFVYTGFRPRFILVKRSVGGIASWATFDTSRSPFNLSQSVIYPNLTNAEATVSFGDILSNGFKLRATAGEMNGASSTYVYAAFAENPFSIARAR